MSLGDVLFLMAFAGVWGGVVGWSIGAEREGRRWERNLKSFTLPAERKGGGL